MAEGRSRFPKTIEEEELCVERAVPKSTRHENKWAVGIFEDCQRDKVQPVTRPIAEMDALTLNYWLSKFIQEVAKCSKISIPSENLVPDCLLHSPIYGGKEPSHRVQSLGLFRQKVRELALWERGPFDILKLKRDCV